MKQYTGALIGGAVGFCLAQALLPPSTSEDEDDGIDVERILAVMSGVLVGARVGQYAFKQHQSAKANPEGCKGSGKLPQCVIDELATINPAQLYRPVVLEHFQIAPVYDNEKTVGTF